MHRILDEHARVGRVGIQRADAQEAELIAGEPVTSVSDARALGRRLLEAGPDLVARAVATWPCGNEFLPFADVPVVDPTGTGDAFTAGLLAALAGAAAPAEAARFASAAAAASVQRLGGRPDLTGLRVAR